MPSLLMVDDEDVVLDLLRESIDWAALGIRQVHTAHSQKQAERILLEQPIDIVLCDIEMPMGNGIALLRWAKEQGLRTVNIILTGHADFEYARQAMELVSMAYILKPISLEEIRAIVAQAVEKIEIERREQERLRYGDNWLENYSHVAEQFWREMLAQDSGGNRREFVQNVARRMGIDIDADNRYALVLVAAKERFVSGGDGWVATPAVCNMMAELVPGLVCPPFAHDGYICGIVQCGDDQQSALQGVEAGCHRLLRECERYLYLQLSCYIGRFALLEALGSELVRLDECERSNVAFLGVFVYSRLTNTKLCYTPPDFQQWRLLLLEKGDAALVRAAVAYLDDLVVRQRINASVIELFFQDYFQMIHHVLREANIPSHSVFHSPRAVELFRLAPQSLPRMKEWLAYIAGEAGILLRAKHDPTTIIERVQDYTEQHILGRIRRGDIAAHVHLTPEYLSRLFKVETGSSLIDYLTARKLDTAKILLRETDLTVSEICTKLGYSNFSYFSQLFRRSVGVSPHAYRQQCRGATGT